MKFSVSLRALAAATALFPVTAFAQRTDDEPEIVVTAPLEGSRIESLQGAEVLRREDIIEQLNGGLGDTLDATPGISTTFFGAGASRPIIRGLGEDRVRVLQNGIGAIDASTASPDHAVTADGLDAERIEILRGAAALAYGGNAIGGVVNVIDQSIPTRAIDGVTFNGLAGYSSVDEGTQANGNLGFGLGDVSILLSAASRDTNNYDTPIGEAPNSWTDLRTYAVGASLAQDWGFGGVAIKRTEDNYGLLPEGVGEPGGHIEMEQTRIETRGDIRIDAGPFDRLDWGAQTSDYEHTEFEGSGEAGTRFTSEGWEARVEAHHGGDQLRGAIGLQATDVDFAAEGDEAFITPTNTQDLGVFAVERYDLGRWGLEGGFRFERREIDNETNGAREFDNVSASAGIFFRPAQNWFAGATIAHTERAPTGIELFAEGPHLATANFEIGDPDIGQETALSIEGSLRYDSGPVRFEINLFRIGFEDYIALVERGDVWWIDEDNDTSGFAPDEGSAPAGADNILPVFTFTQQDATFSGGEISVAARLFEAAGFTFTGEAALDLVRADFDDGGHPPRIPPQALTLGLEAENPNWTGRVAIVDTAEQDRLAAFETATDGYTFLNASFAFRPQGEDGAWTIRLDGRNLTDELGRVHSSFLKDELPLPGRNVRLTLTTEF
ncbi:TonB-dependent receptor [Terricaulis silvestris]|uniref:Putative TonB-dependent receptor n=1 Tax=Terricaulis silvestris TaxID=2686094 RepID=A0A6I6MNJ9_9CAUL|nr:TonB-dependent receptor [Terricaulis silvestris]QGZ97115.1 putative TonB-dependent receptor precursor [Terricaulis silvestris]